MKIGIKRKKPQVIEIYSAKDIYRNGKMLYEKDQLIRSVKGSKEQIRKYVRNLAKDKYYIRIDTMQQEFEKEVAEVPVFVDSLKKL